MKTLKAKATHTPGPWSIVNWGEATDHPYIVPAKENPETQRESKICDVYNPESEANARLIAAAPELLELCKEAVEVYYDAGLDNTDHVVKRMKSAIAKAEGKE